MREVHRPRLPPMLTHDPQHLGVPRPSGRAPRTGSRRPARSSRSGTPRCWRSPACAAAGAWTGGTGWSMSGGVSWSFSGIAGSPWISHHLREARAEVRVARAAVARVEAGVDVQAHQVGEPPDLAGARGLAARQGAERVEVDGVGALRHQVGVEERGVARLVVGVLVDVVRHVVVDVDERPPVGRGCRRPRRRARCTAARGRSRGSRRRPGTAGSRCRPSSAGPRARAGAARPQDARRGRGGARQPEAGQEAPAPDRGSAFGRGRVTVCVCHETPPGGARCGWARAAVVSLTASTRPARRTPANDLRYVSAEDRFSWCDGVD